MPRPGLSSILAGFLLMVGLLGGSGCGGGAPAARPTLRLAVLNWTEAVAMAGVAREVLEQRLGYQVELERTTLEGAFSALAAGKVDVFLNAWLPTTHGEYVRRYGADLMDLGASFEDARIGLAAPVSAPFESLEELAHHRDALGGRIVGIDPEAGVMQATRRAIEDYQLGFELEVSSSRNMLEQLAQAVKEDRPLVVTAWSPHWMFHRWRLKWLRDPKGIYPDVEAIHTLARRGLVQEHPRAARFLARMRFDHLQLPSLLDAVLPSRDAPAQAVRDWLAGEQGLVEGWLAEDAR